MEVPMEAFLAFRPSNTGTKMGGSGRTHQKKKQRFRLRGMRKNCSQANSGPPLRRGSFFGRFFGIIFELLFGVLRGSPGEIKSLSWRSSWGVCWGRFWKLFGIVFVSSWTHFRMFFRIVLGFRKAHKTVFTYNGIHANGIHTKRSSHTTAFKQRTQNDIHTKRYSHTTVVAQSGIHRHPYSYTRYSHKPVCTQDGIHIQRYSHKRYSHKRHSHKMVFTQRYSHKRSSHNIQNAIHRFPGFRAGGILYA